MPQSSSVTPELIDSLARRLINVYYLSFVRRGDVDALRMAQSHLNSSMPATYGRGERWEVRGNRVHVTEYGGKTLNVRVPLHALFLHASTRGNQEIADQIRAAYRVYTRQDETCTIDGEVVTYGNVTQMFGKLEQRWFDTGPSLAVTPEEMFGDEIQEYMRSQPAAEPVGSPRAALPASTGGRTYEAMPLF